MEQAFKNRLLELVSTKNQNSQIFTKSAYMNMIRKVKEAKSKSTNKSPGEYHRLRRYDILEVNNEERLILPVKEDGLVIYYVHTDDVFDILNSVHLALKHGGRSRMKKEINKKYKNITQEIVMIYLTLCKVCQKKQNCKKDSTNTLWQNKQNKSTINNINGKWLDNDNVNEWNDNLIIDTRENFNKQILGGDAYEENRCNENFRNDNILISGETGAPPQSREIEWNERLIAAIRQKPGLYEKNHPDREILNKLWSEVFETMIPNWNDLSVEERIVKGREMKDRWRNLRTCFRRELNKQRFEENERGMRKRKKYVYYDDLMFLRPTMEDEEINSETDSIKIKEEEEEVSDIEEEISNENLSNYYTFSIKSPTLKTNETTAVVHKDPLKVEEVDEDKTFLLSLLPSFRRMEEEEKLEAKMEFLLIIKNTLQKRKRTDVFLDTRGCKIN